MVPDPPKSILLFLKARLDCRPFLFETTICVCGGCREEAIADFKPAWERNDNAPLPTRSLAVP
jgi:hypothetical protein